MKTTQHDKIKDLLKRPIKDQNIPIHLIKEIVQNTNHPNNFPLGTNCYFIYSHSRSKFFHLEDNAEFIFHMKANEIKDLTTTEFFAKIADDTHYEAVYEIFKISFEFHREHKDKKDLVFNLEFNIRTISKIKKRLICQWKSFMTDENDIPDIMYGYYTDITHFKKDGLPVLYVVADNRLIFSEEAKTETIIRNKNIPFTKRQVEILKLMSSGFSAKEVAQKMNLSVATVYTQSKLIKNKTGMDIKAALKYLDEKGLI